MSDAIEERTKRHHHAIRILAKTEEWPQFQEWIRYQILAQSTGCCTQIVTEEDKANHNQRIGMLAAFKLLISLEDTIKNADEYDLKLKERIKEAEEANKKRR